MVNAESKGLKLTIASILMFIGGLFGIVWAAILFLYLDVFPTASVLAVVFAFIGGGLSIARKSYKGTTVCCLIAGILFALGFAVSFTGTSAPRALIITLIGMICMIIATYIVGKNKHEFK